MIDAGHDGIHALAVKYRLGRMLNAGGQAFYIRETGPFCQVSDYNDEQDLAKLTAWCAAQCPADMPGFDAVWGLAKPNTCFGLTRSRAFWNLASRAAGADGDVVQLGVWRGGTALLAAYAAGRMEERALYLYDTFTGYPHNGRFGAGNPEADTRALMAATSLRTMFVVGDFMQAIYVPEQIALAHIDCDLAAPAARALELFWPLLSTGGIMIIDDYGVADCTGLTQVVDSWRAANADSHHFENHDGQVVLWR